MKHFLSALALCAALAACKTNKQYNSAVDAANKSGQQSGQQTGYQSGYSAGNTDGQSSGYASGQTDGYNSGYATGNTDGYNSGYATGNTDGYANGTNDANAAHAGDYGNGFNAGVQTGYNLAGSVNGFINNFTSEFGGYGDQVAFVKFANGNPNYVVLTVSGAENYTAAFYIGDYVPGTEYWTSVNQSASAGNDTYWNLTDNGDGTYTCGGNCESYNGQYNTGMIFEKIQGATKDLSKARAFVEAASVEMTSNSLASQFGLSKERSVQVAKMAQAWNKLAGSRKVTDADADSFVQQLAGVSIQDMKNAETAMMQFGNQAPLNSVLDSAAKVNGTSSENMRAIMNQMFVFE